jgi:predicted nucleic acid-binding Zn ribbon protein
MRRDYNKFPLGPPKRSAREQVLAEWRRVDLAPLEKERARPAQTVGDILPGVLSQRLRFDQRREEAEIARVWANLIDPNIVAHARPVGLRNGTLFVSVDSNVWLDEIVRYRRKEILDRLQHGFGKKLIVRIAFRVG